MKKNHKNTIPLFEEFVSDRSNIIRDLTISLVRRNLAPSQNVGIEKFCAEQGISIGEVYEDSGIIHVTFSGRTQDLIALGYTYYNIDPCTIVFDD